MIFGNEGVYPKKWMQNEMYRNLGYYVEEARKDAYNHKLIARRKADQVKRPKLHFPVLNLLVSERLRYDARNQAPDSRQVFQVSNSSKDQLRFRFSQEYFQNLVFQPINVPSSLQSLALQVTAKHLKFYEEDHINIVLDHLTAPQISLLNYYAASFHTLTASTFLLLANFPLEVIYFPSTLPDKLLLDYISILREKPFALHDKQDNWEEIDFNSLDFIDRTNFLQSIIFYLNKFTLTRLHDVISSLSSLSLLTFIGTDLSINQVTSFDDYMNLSKSSTSIFSQFLQLILSYSPRELSITLVHCSWVDFDDFNDFFHMNSQIEEASTKSISLEIVLKLDSRDGIRSQEEERSKWLQLSEDYRKSNLPFNIHLIFSS